MTDSQQTVTDDTKNKEAPGDKLDSGRANGAQTEDDLESLLKEYDSPDASKKNKKDDTPKELTKEDVEYIRQRKEIDVKESLTKDIQHAVKLTKGEVEAPDELVEGFLHHKVSNDPRMRKAWEERTAKPAEWDKILKAVSPEFFKTLDAYVEKRIQSSNGALASAVHSAKTVTTTGGKQYSLGELTRMPAHEFDAVKRGQK